VMTSLCRSPGIEALLKSRRASLLLRCRSARGATCAARRRRLVRARPVTCSFTRVAMRPAGAAQACALLGLARAVAVSSGASWSILRRTWWAVLLPV
jgi:hypothetical protein